MKIVVLDANVLFSIDATDVLLTLAVGRTIRVHWSPTVLDEVRRNLREHRNLSDDAISHRVDQMNRALPDALRLAPEDLIDRMPINPKDRHVLALAVQVDASVIVTENIRDFPSEVCVEFGIEAMTTDAFLASQAGDDRARMLDALSAMARRRRRPPRTVDDILERFAGRYPFFVRAILDPDA